MTKRIDPPERAGTAGDPGERLHSQGPARGYSWPPFQPGHRLSVKHGSYAPLLLGERVAELAPHLEALVPAMSPSDRPAVELLALTLARLERGERAVEEAEQRGDIEGAGPRERDVRAWIGLGVKLLSALGMTPTARARLGLDVALARRATITDLHAQAAIEGDSEEDSS
jgi:hypothetical protein